MTNTLNIKVAAIIINPLSMSESKEGNLGKSPQQIVRLEMIIAFQLQIKEKLNNNENLITGLRNSS